MQKDMKKLVAYSSVSHLGFCMLGMFALNPNGLTGSIIQQINHGISTGALFLIVGMIYERRHTREISEFGGIPNVMPVYAIITPDHDDVVDGPAAAEWLHRRIHHPAGNVSWRTGCGRPGRFLGIVLGAAYLLWLYQRVFFGKVTIQRTKSCTILTRVNWRASLRW